MMIDLFYLVVFPAMLYLTWCSRILDIFKNNYVHAFPSGVLNNVSYGGCDFIEVFASVHGLNNDKLFAKEKQNYVGAEHCCHFTRLLFLSAYSFSLLLYIALTRICSSLCWWYSVTFHHVTSLAASKI